MNRNRFARLALLSLAMLGLPTLLAAPPLLRPVVAGYTGAALTILLLDLTASRIERIPARLRAVSLAAVYLGGIAVTMTVTARFTLAAVSAAVPV